MTARACDGCTLCCQVFYIAELQKPMGVMCPHAIPGRGCGIYEQRPNVCRVSDCLWLCTPNVPEYWKPAESRMVLGGDPTGTLLSVMVEPGFDDVWKKDPYHADLRKWARDPTWRVQVLTEGYGWVIFPEEDLFLGERKVDDLIVGFGYRQYPFTRQPSVKVRHGDGTETEVLGQHYRLS